MIDVTTLVRRGIGGSTETVRRLDAEGEQLFAQLKAMSPGDPGARATIAAVFAILEQLRMVPNFYPDDEYPARIHLHHEATRLLHESRLPNWRPD